MEEHLVQQLVRKRTEVEEASSGGEYLPLSVYHQRGFPVDLIEARCLDKRQHPVLGLTYRVSIDSVYSKAIEEMVRSELFEHKQRKRPNTQPAAGERPAANDSEEEEEASKKKRRKGSSSSSREASSSNESSSTSSSASAKEKKAKRSRKKNKREKKEKKSKKGNKDKKEKKDKKDKEAAAAAEKAARAEAAAVRRLASKVLAKTAPLIAALKAGIDDAAFKHLPKFAVTPVQNGVAVLGKYNMEAMAVIGKGSVKLSFTEEDLNSAVSSAYSANGLMQKLLKTTREHVQ